MSGRHFLQIPGPTNVPDRVLRAMDRPVPDHRGPEMPPLTREIIDRLRRLFGTSSAEVVLFPGSGTAGWEASLVNTVSPGDQVLAFNNGHFSHLWADCARRLGLVVEEEDVEWGRGVHPELVEQKLTADRAHAIRAVLVVHNETSTGVTSNIAAVRAAIDRAGHPALLLVDAVSSLGSIKFELDRWGVDVALTGAQKGLMLPPGMAILAASERAVIASKKATAPRFFLDWQPVIDQMRTGYFPYTPATLLLFGLREALRMLDEEGLDAVYARHGRLAGAVRAAVDEWDLAILCKDPAEYSNTLTAVVMPDGTGSDPVLKTAESRFDLSLGTGLGPLKNRVFRIGHLGSLNELEVLATVGGVELVLNELGLQVRLGAGVSAAQRSFATPVPTHLA